MWAAGGFVLPGDLGSTGCIQRLLRWCAKLVEYVGLWAGIARIALGDWHLGELPA